MIAKSFARIFFRNAINIGLPILESDEAVNGIRKGDEIEVDLTSGKIKNLTKKEEYSAQKFPEFMKGIIESGGLIGYIKKTTLSLR